MDRIFAPPLQKFKLTAYVAKYKKEFCLQAIGGIFYNSVVVFGAIFLGRTIDAANLLYKGEAELSYFYMNLFAFLGITMLVQLARYLKRFYLRLLSNFMNCDIRAGLMSSLFGMEMADLSSEKVGDMMSRMIGDVEHVGHSVQRTITEMWDTVVLMLSYFIACMIYSPEITLIASIPIPIVIIGAQLVRHPLYNIAQKARRAASDVNVYLQHNVSGIALLRLFGLETAGRKKFSKLLDKNLKWSIAATALQEGVAPLYILFATCGIIFAVGKGGEYVINEMWTIGMFTAYLSMFTAMTVRTSKVGKVMNTWHGAAASWDRICEKLQRESSREVQYTSLQTHDDVPVLEVNSLSFRYPLSDDNCVTDISFSAKKGEIIGITGPVGSGKSALAAALSGLYDYNGEVLINGIALNDLGEKRFEYISYMDSEQFVFSDTLEFNITLDRAQKGMDLTEALELASMQEDVCAFEEGVKTRLMERGVRISGGQRQRVSLARVWYGQSEIILLDDPFSAVDVNMEQRIMNSIRTQTGNKTVLLFSHRLSTFDKTDKVIVLEKGSVSQSGTHNELMEQDGLYRDIYLAQKFMERGDDN